MEGANEFMFKHTQILFNAHLILVTIQYSLLTFEIL